MKRNQILTTACMTFVACLAVHEATVAAESEWKQEFERICIQVESAGGLDGEQLQELVKDADRLLEHLLNVEDPQVKIYVQRLERCRDFYSFMSKALLLNEARTGMDG